MIKSKITRTNRKTLERCHLHFLLCADNDDGNDNDDDDDNNSSIDNVN